MVYLSSGCDCENPALISGAVVLNYDISGGFAGSGAKHTSGALGALSCLGAGWADGFCGLPVRADRYPKSAHTMKVCKGGIV
jgi:hypothetical protein